MKKIINNLDKIIILIAIIFFVILGLKSKEDDIKEKNKENNIFLTDIESNGENISESSLNITKDNASKETNESISETSEEIFVHITGCVQKQGVYKLKNDNRINDLVKMAGGLCADADLERINLSRKLVDEMKVHIYKIGEKDKIDTIDLTNESSSMDLKNNISTSKKININTASLEELTTLSGIGETRAKEIIEYRKNNKFLKIEDLMNISGIGNKTFEKIKENITIDWNYKLYLL